jgi:general secretion pathway protein C
MAVELLKARKALWGGAAAAGALALYASLPGEPPAAAPSFPPPPPAPPAASAPAQAVAAPLPVSAEGLVLYGVSGGGAAGMAAVIGPASGSPRVVPAGRDYRPGLRLTEVGATYAILSSAGRETRLDLGGAGGGPEPRRAEPPAAPAAAPATGFAGMDAIALRLGMSPRRQGGRITGFQMKRGADLPILHQAGLRPGDVIVAVNGQALESEEKLLELPQEIAGSYTAEFDVDRDGRRLKLSLPVNARK